MKDFIRGIGSVIDLFPTNTELDTVFPPILSDEEAFKKDLEEVGSDMHNALQIMQKKYLLKKNK